MTGSFFRGVLFFCSYFPLTIIICYLQFGVWPWWVIALLGGLFGVVPLLGTWGRTTLSGEEFRETCENELELEDLHHLMWLYLLKSAGPFFICLMMHMEHRL